jgi:hypothetical protein
LVHAEQVVSYQNLSRNTGARADADGGYGQTLGDKSCQAFGYALEDQRETACLLERQCVVK